MTEFLDEEDWAEERVRLAFIDAFDEGLRRARERRSSNPKWPYLFALRVMRKTGVSWDTLENCLEKGLTSNDVEMYSLHCTSYLQAANFVAIRGLKPPLAYETSDALVADFWPLFKAELAKQGFPHFLMKNITFEELYELRGFQKEMDKIAECLTADWNRAVERKRQADLVAEDIGYRRLERTERHRLKRLAEEEAARKAKAEEELKRNTEAARIERDRRKREARERAEQANERAKQRAEAKRAEWLAAHPRKHQ